MTTFIPARRRTWWRRVPWSALLWLAGVTAVTGWWAVRAPGPWWHIPPAAAVFGVLLGAALIRPER